MAGLAISMNLQQVRGELRAERERVRREVNELIEVVGEETLERVRALTPENTGATARGWILRVIGGRGKGQGVTLAVVTHPFNQVGAKHPVTGAVVNDGTHNLLESLEFGTRPHVIVPKEPGGFLRFVVDGNVVYTKRVDHPGTRAYAMTRIAAVEAEQLAAAGLQTILVNLKQRIET